MTHRPILTTAIRRGRMTDAQVDALSQLFPFYALKLEEHAAIAPTTLFPNSSSQVLEIGFGMGHSLLEMAAAHPTCGYLGIELHEPGIGRILNEIHTAHLTNLKIIRGNALTAMETHFSEGAFDTLQIFFPDPWPKKKHWKRRLIQPHTLPCMARVLKSKGRLHIATDWEPYAAHIMRVLSESPLFENPHGLLQYAPRPEARPLTKFEKRGLRYGHGVWDIEFKKC